jgi:formylmethanofuran dehydrogenase subunit E
LILGLRMGVIAWSMLKAQNHKDLAAIMLVDPEPPVSCAVDGVQVASGCTLGKGTIRVSGSTDRVAGEFHAGSRICTITVKPKVLKELLDVVKKANEKEILEMAETLLSRPDEKLFHTTVAV